MDDALVQRATAAAVEVATSRGLAVDAPTVIADGSNVVVHLAPAPVVARVMSGTVVLHDDPRRWLTREVAVLRFLDPTGLVVGPSPLVDPGPSTHDGLWMTFVRLAELEPTPGGREPLPVDDAREFGAALRALHDALAPYDGELGDARELAGGIARLLRRVPPGPGRDDVAGRLACVHDPVFASGHPVQALHGDVSITNRLSTATGRRWNDFEDAFRGPVHWDVASLVSDLAHRGSSADAVAALLDAYGWGDPAALEPFRVAQDAYTDAWRLYDRTRRGGPASP